MFKLIIFAVICIFTFVVGGVFATYLLAGIFNLAGIVFLIETIDPLKKFVTKFKNLFDVILFAFGIYASIALGVTIGISFIIAGLGYTMVYKPYLSGEFDVNEKDKKESNSYDRFRHL